MEDVLLTVITLVITWRWGDWRHWKQHYSTILFWGLGNMIYCNLTIAKPLWTFTTIVPASIGNIFMVAIIFPCVGLLFLPYFPQNDFLIKLIYVLFWTFIFSFIEWWALLIHHFAHFNGWNLIYSILFNFGMFILLQIHSKEPRWAWLISLVTGIFLITVFDINL
jgi:hypothetical protein